MAVQIASDGEGWIFEDNPGTLSNEKEEEMKREDNCEHGMIPAPCFWKLEDSESATWRSGCDEAWHFPEGTPMENKIKFCPFCGKRILEVGQ